MQILSVAVFCFLPILLPSQRPTNTDLELCSGGNIDCVDSQHAGAQALLQTKTGSQKAEAEGEVDREVYGEETEGEDETVNEDVTDKEENVEAVEENESRFGDRSGDKPAPPGRKDRILKKIDESKNSMMSEDDEAATEGKKHPKAHTEDFASKVADSSDLPNEVRGAVSGTMLYAMALEDSDVSAACKNTTWTMAESFITKCRRKKNAKALNVKFGWNKRLQHHCKKVGGMYCHDHVTKRPFCYGTPCKGEDFISDLDCDSHRVDPGAMAISLDIIIHEGRYPCKWWCKSDRAKNGPRHCPPGNMAYLCGGCSHCQGSSDHDSGGHSSHPVPNVPAAPAGSDKDGFMNSHWNNYYLADNPLKIKSDPTRSNNYFIILGDWGGGGCTSPTKNCQIATANLMKTYVKEQKDAGKNLLFIASLGDNFYGSVDGGRKFTSVWRDVYGDDLTSNYAWLACLGNHDFDHGDPSLGCPRGKQYGGQTYGGVQLNNDKNGKRPAWTSKFWLPDYNYHYEIPEVDLEVISVDMNNNGGGFLRAGAFCHGHMGKVQQSGYALLRDRGQKTKAKNVLIIQHYPGKNWEVKHNFAQGGGGHGAKVISTFGHTHSNWIRGDSIQSGNGGGYKGAWDYGFVAVHLGEGNEWRSELKNVGCRIQRATCR